MVVEFDESTLSKKKLLDKDVKLWKWISIVIWPNFKWKELEIEKLPKTSTTHFSKMPQKTAYMTQPKERFQTQTFHSYD